MSPEGEHKVTQATECVHAGYVPAEHHHSANPPIYMTSTFEFDHAEDCAAAFAGSPKPGQTHIYTRISNPTNEIVEKKLATLEGAEAAVTFASGMGAISGTLWTFLDANSTLISSNRIYGCTFALFSHLFPRFGVDVVFVDFTDLEAVRKAAAGAKKTLKFLYCESIQNPTNDVPDIPALAEIAHSHGARLIVDNTFASPIACQPLKLGADIVLHSATKFLMGGVCTAGCVMSDAATIGQIRGVGLKDATGAVLSPEAAWHMSMQIETLDLRYRKMSETACKLAQYLEKHPKVERVVHTSLASHPQKAIYDRDFALPNTLMSVYLKGGVAECAKVMNAFKLIMRAVSLGKTHSLADHAASMTHSTYSAEERKKYGIEDNLIRFSTGIESAEDIIADWEQALAQI